MGVPSLVPHPALRHDLRNPLGIAGAEIPAAFEDFEDILPIDQPDEGSALCGEFCERVEGPLLGRRPLDIAANAVLAPRGT